LLFNPVVSKSPVSVLTRLFWSTELTTTLLSAYITVGCGRLPIIINFLPLFTIACFEVLFYRQLTMLVTRVHVNTLFIAVFLMFVFLYVVYRHLCMYFVWLWSFDIRYRRVSVSVQSVFCSILHTVNLTSQGILCWTTATLFDTETICSVWPTCTVLNCAHAYLRLKTILKFISIVTV